MSIEHAPQRERTGGLLAGYVDKYGMAAELQVSPRTIDRYVNSKDGLPFTKLRGRMLFNLESARKWLKARETQRNQSRKSAT